MNKDHWTLDDIPWDRFDASKVDPDLLAAVKTASLVEANSPDYVTYLNNVFDHDADAKAAFAQWGEEEAQHGKALAAWAKLADPTFDFDGALAKFRERYSLPLDATESVRGSKPAEMVARCVVECGTSSFYTAMKEATDEPVLKAIAGHIAADEFAHYKLFLETFQSLAEQEKIGRLNRIMVALGRFKETEDDELAMAHYCANVPDDSLEYERVKFSADYERCAMALYRRRHIERASAMIAKAMGLKPQGAPARLFGKAMWALLRFRQRKGAQQPSALAA